MPGFDRILPLQFDLAVFVLKTVSVSDCYIRINTFCPYAGNIFALKHLTVNKIRIFTRLVKFVVHTIIFRFFQV